LHSAKYFEVINWKLLHALWYTKETFILQPRSFHVTNLLHDSSTSGFLVRAYDQ